jgi:hypothetical protein
LARLTHLLHADGQFVLIPAVLIAIGLKRERTPPDVARAGTK